MPSVISSLTTKTISLKINLGEKIMGMGRKKSVLKMKRRKNQAKLKAKIKAKKAQKQS